MRRSRAASLCWATEALAVNTECWTCVHGEVICGECRDVAEFIDTVFITCRDKHPINLPGCPWYEEIEEKKSK